MMIDIDNFKEYNDHYGHLNGDKIIIQIASIIKSYAKRSNDLAVRFGGDEFIILLSDATEEVSLEVANKIQNELLKLNIPHEFSAVGLRISLSIGIATLIPQRDTLMMQLIEMADNALYISKDKGRNQINVYNKKSPS